MPKEPGLGEKLIPKGSQPNPREKGNPYGGGAGPAKNVVLRTSVHDYGGTVEGAYGYPCAESPAEAK